MQMTILSSCSNLTVLSQLLQMNLQVPTHFTVIKDMLKMLPAVIPFLQEDAALEAACYYGVNLLNTLKQQSDVLHTFNRFPAFIRYLVEKSIGAKDDTAAATISLLKQLVRNQVCLSTKRNLLTFLSVPPSFQNSLLEVRYFLSVFDDITFLVLMAKSSLCNPFV